MVVSIGRFKIFTWEDVEITKHLFINGCLGFQVDRVYIAIVPPQDAIVAANGAYDGIPGAQ